MLLFQECVEETQSWWFAILNARKIPKFFVCAKNQLLIRNYSSIALLHAIRIKMHQSSISGNMQALHKLDDYSNYTKTTEIKDGNKI